MTMRMTNSEIKALELEKAEITKLIAPLIIVMVFFCLTFLLFLIDIEDFSNPIFPYIIIGFMGLIFLIVLVALIYRIIYFMRSNYAVKFGDEVECEVVLVKEKIKGRVNFNHVFYFVKVYFFDINNEKKVFTTRLLYNEAQGKVLRSKTYLLAKQYRNHLVITEDLTP